MLRRAGARLATKPHLSIYCVGYLERGAYDKSIRIGQRIERSDRH
jgi:hypothetical protein